MFFLINIVIYIYIYTSLDLKDGFQRDHILLSKCSEVKIVISMFGNYIGVIEVYDFYLSIPWALLFNISRLIVPFTSVLTTSSSSRASILLHSLATTTVVTLSFRQVKPPESEMTVYHSEGRCAYQR